MSLIIVTGMSGAGKSVAANVLEDIGYYCIDNLPPALIKPVAELSLMGNSDLKKVAFVTDIRGGKMFDDIIPTVEHLRGLGCELKVLFLDASNDKLVRRYKETRRRHPMAGKSELSIAEAVEKERELLRPLKEMSDFVIDTTTTSTSGFKQRISDLFLDDISSGMTVQILSFGFKNGCVSEADIVFDVRCLTNPFYIDELKHKTGLDSEVRDFVLNLPEAQGLIERLFALIDYSLPLYRNEGKNQLVIAIGCTGGKHRSVVFAETLCKHLADNDYRTVINHRDISKE